jgi:hypothetical protein
VNGLLTTNSLSATNGTIDNIAIKRPFSSQNNQVIGYNSLQNINSSGYDNFVFGSNTANGITTGNNNVILGNAGFGSCPAVASTTSIGNNNGVLLTTGSNNTFLGNNSGGTLTTGSNNTFIGYLANTNLGSWSNSTAIGSGATITGNNQVVLGTSTETVVIPNTITYSYTSVPTFTSSQIGYSVTTTSNNSINFTTAGLMFCVTSGLPIGVYIIGFHFSQNSGSQFQFSVVNNASGTPAARTDITPLMFGPTGTGTVGSSITYRSTSASNVFGLCGFSFSGTNNAYVCQIQLTRIA